MPYEPGGYAVQPEHSRPTPRSEEEWWKDVQAPAESVELKLTPSSAPIPASSTFPAEATQGEPICVCQPATSEKPGPPPSLPRANVPRAPTFALSAEAAAQSALITPHSNGGAVQFDEPAAEELTPDTESKPRPIPWAPETIKPIRRYTKRSPKDLPRDPQPPNTRFVPGPEITVVAYIGNDTVTKADEELALRAFKETYPDRWVALNSGLVNAGTALADLMGEIYEGHNKTPPDKFTTPTWNKFLSEGDSKGWLQAEGAIYCSSFPNSGLLRFSHAPLDVRHYAGKTEDMFAHLVTFEGNDFAEVELFAETESCRTWRIYHQTQFGSIPAAGSELLYLSAPPQIWQEVFYTICCDSIVEVSVYASHFPSHKAYWGGNLIGSSMQSNLSNFLWTGKGSPKAGGVLVANITKKY